MSELGRTTTCRACGGDQIESFYRQDAVPVHSALVLRDRQAALDVPTGSVDLCVCRGCGFVGNRAFDPQLLDYDEDYDGSQAFSSTFDTFHRGLAAELVERCELRGKTILEVGCGRGDFLEMLCALGNNRGVGFEPSVLADQASPDSRIRIVRDYFPDGGHGMRADLVCCKMTLEHIGEPRPLIAALRSAAAPSGKVFLQVPNADKVLADTAFWDIYYEHCSYFGADALAQMLQSAGFGIEDVWQGYDEQYLMAIAQPGRSTSRASVGPAPTIELARQFADTAASRIETRRDLIEHRAARGDRIVIWGAGSKAIAFLAATGCSAAIAGLVDVNPNKAGTFAAGSGLAIEAPETLRRRTPDVVLIVNPIYRGEIAKQLAGMAIHSDLWTL